MSEANDERAKARAAILQRRASLAIYAVAAGVATGSCSGKTQYCLSISVDGGAGGRPTTAGTGGCLSPPGGYYSGGMGGMSVGGMGGTRPTTCLGVAGTSVMGGTAGASAAAGGLANGGASGGEASGGEASAGEASGGEAAGGQAGHAGVGAGGTGPCLSPPFE